MSHPTPHSDQNLLVWGEKNMEEGTLRQAAHAARLPFVKDAGPLALMPDAHIGMGATIGSVIPTIGAIIPSAVGVDIGCGMIAVETTVTGSELPDTVEPWLAEISRTIPAGVGRGHEQRSTRHDARLPEHPGGLGRKEFGKAVQQLGSLGSGNHFVEMCTDETDQVWLVLHSGSRGVGNQLAQGHIKTAKGLMKQWMIHLDDPDLAYLVEGTPEFDAYVADLLWAQDYARLNRELMMDAALAAFGKLMGFDGYFEESRINCHHNFTQREHHNGRNLWITRKGAIQMQPGQLGVIPGSMGTRSYIVEGLGNPSSYNSASHGAGRRMSRGQAKRELSIDTFKAQMNGKVWQESNAQSLLDEAPGAYKDIDAVMDAQLDLVRPLHALVQIANYKGQ